MEDLISTDEIREITGLSANQFKAFRRLGLVSPHIKKTSIVRLNQKKTEKKGKETYSPAGFTYYYPRQRVLAEISWVLRQRDKGLNLSEIQSEYIKTKILEEEQLKRMMQKYEKTLTLPVDTKGNGIMQQKLIQDAVSQLTERIKTEHQNRNIKTLVFLVEQERQQKLPGFSMNISIKLDLTNSEL